MGIMSVTVHSNGSVLRYRAMKVGDPQSADSQVGALISKEHKEKVLRYIQYAIEDGGTIECGHGVDDLELPERNRKVSCINCITECKKKQNDRQKWFML